MTVLHGIEVDGEGSTAWYRFGLLRVAHCLTTGSFPADPTKTRRWRDRRFLQAVKKLQDTVWKFDRAAGHVEHCRVAIAKWVDFERRGEAGSVHISDPVLGDHLDALQDLPLHLDSLLVYLRIEADALASLTPYFYTPSGSIPTRSFREQRKWFLGARSGFDGEYEQILAESTSWFDQLAGKEPSGLRDVVVHRAGTYQLGWTMASNGGLLELRAGVVDANGFVEDDLISALVSINSGWFEFLDRYCVLFRRRLQPEVPWADLLRDELSRYVHYDGTEPPSAWVYRRFMPSAA